LAGQRLLLVLDGAGRHKAKALPLPERLRLWHLPPYPPECNPTERRRPLGKRLREVLARRFRHLP
jgi:hypothetical protein